jgi:GDP-4-dehydro-6-deoxy-D-mannose reductase
MATAFITGITGMVGSHLADYLIEKTDWKIVGLIRWRSPLNNISHLIERTNKNDRIKLLYGDLSDSISIEAAISEAKPDYVFHLAAQSFPKTSFTAPLDTMDTNIQGTARVLEAIKNHAPSAIIHVCSSSEVFGRVPPEKLPIDEECTFHPASPYAISKVGTDLIGRFYAEAYGLKVMTTRMFTHTGPRRGDVFAESSFAKQIALAEAGFIEPVIKVGNLKSLRTVADVRDAVHAYYLLVTKNPIAGEYYNIGGQHTAEIGEILNHLISISTLSQSLKIEVDPDRLRPIDADLQIPNTSKFENHTGWKQAYSFEQTMQDLLDYWRNKVKSEGNRFLQR